MSITFPIVKYCVVCEHRLTPMDMRRWDTCDACVKAGQDREAEVGHLADDEAPRA